MKNIDFKFIIDLEDHHRDSKWGNKGVVFHRFLPENESDKIQKKLQNGNGVISFWFERRLKLVNKGGVTGEKVFYDYKSKLEDENIISRQSHIGNEVLFGKLSIKNLSIDTLKAIENNKIGSKEYIKFGKEIVKSIYTESKELIEIFRDLYRHFWIGKLKNWDSRTQSLSTYCKLVLHLKYSIDNGETWHLFQPDEPRNIIEIVGTIGHKYHEYISESDWLEIKKLYANSYRPSLISELIASSHETCSDGDLQKAFVEAVTALELSLAEKIKENNMMTDRIEKEIQAFYNLNLKSQLSIIAIGQEKLNSEKIESGFKAIDIRHKIVHEAYVPEEKEKIIFYQLLSLISILIQEPVTKFPPEHESINVWSDKMWTEYYERNNY